MINERRGLWTSTYADWDHDFAALEIDVTKLRPVDAAEAAAFAGRLADQLRPFQAPAGCSGCGGCRVCLRVLA